MIKDKLIESVAENLNTIINKIDTGGEIYDNEVDDLRTYAMLLVELLNLSSPKIIRKAGCNVELEHRLRSVANDIPGNRLVN